MGLHYGVNGALAMGPALAVLMGQGWRRGAAPHVLPHTVMGSVGLHYGVNGAPLMGLWGSTYGVSGAPAVGLALAVLMGQGCRRGAAPHAPPHTVMG